MNEIMNLYCSDGAVKECDEKQKLVYYMLVHLPDGTKLIEECSYIDAFMHEDQKDKVQEYSFLQNFITAIG